MTVPKTRDPGRESRAMRFMIVAVLGYSIIPVFIAVMDTHRAPFLFTAFMYAGQFLGLGAYTLFLYPKLFFRSRPRRVLIGRLGSPTMLLTMAGYLNYAFFSWSTQFIDPAVTTAIFGGWTLATVLLLGWVFKSEQRYERASGALVGALLVGFAGFALAILSQRKDILDPDRWTSATLDVGAGVLFAVAAMIMATLGSFALKWGVETARRLQPITGQSYDRANLEVAGVLTGIAIAALVATPINFAIGLARGESLSGLSSLDLAAAFAVGMGSLGFCTILFRRANLLTRNLGVIGMTYATLPLSVVWLALLGEIAVERPLYLAAGTALVAASNMLVHLLGNRAS